MLNRISFASTALCLVAALSLSGCGGGGDGSGDIQDRSDFKEGAIGNPGVTLSGTSPKALTVENGNSGVTLQSYPLDVDYPGSSGTTYIVSEEVEQVLPESDAFDSFFFYSKANPAKFGAAFSTEDEQYFACISSAWSASEAAEIRRRLELSTIAVCASTMLVDVANHRIQFSNLLLTSVSDASRTVTISADFQWTPQPNNHSWLATVLPGSTGLASGQRVFYSMEGTTGERLGSIEVSTSAMIGDDLEIDLKSVHGENRKLILTATAMGTRKFTCIGDGWTASEKSEIAVLLGSLPACPAGVSYDWTSQMLVMDKVWLSAEGKTLGLDMSTHFPLENGSSSIGTPSETASPSTGTSWTEPATNEVVLGEDRFALTQAGTAGTQFGGFTAGWVNMVSDAVVVSAGHLRDTPAKFLVHAQARGAEMDFYCISAAWTAAEKAALNVAYGSVPQTCGSAVQFNGDTRQFRLNRLAIPSGSDSVPLPLSINTTLMPIDFETL